MDADISTNLGKYTEAKQIAVDRWEREYLSRLMSVCTSVSQASRVAQMDRHWLNHLLHKHGLKGTEGTGDTKGRDE